MGDSGHSTKANINFPALQKPATNRLSSSERQRVSNMTLSNGEPVVAQWQVLWGGVRNPST